MRTDDANATPAERVHDGANFERTDRRVLQTLPAIQRNECIRGNRQYEAADYRVIGFNIRTIQENVGRYDFVLYKIAARVSQYRCKIRGVFELVKKIHNIIEWYLVNLAYRDFQPIQIQKLRVF